MLLAMIVLAALGTLSALTVVSVQGGIATAGNDRFHTLASYAAESGAAAAMDFLRKTVSSVNGWTDYIKASPTPTAIWGNNAAVGAANNPFSPELQSSYSVVIVNNRSDSGGANSDTDKRVVIRSTGYGPNGAVATLEWEVSALNANTTQRPCSVYSQRGESEDDSGRNDCLGTVSKGTTTLYQPGG